MDRRLGRPLPHQLPNPTRADPKAIKSFPRRAHTVLLQVSLGYPVPLGTFPRVTHPSAARTEVLARLACVRPAASVRSEPGSNSQVESARALLDSQTPAHHHPAPKGTRQCLCLQDLVSSTDPTNSEADTHIIGAETPSEPICSDRSIDPDQTALISLQYSSNVKEQQRQNQPEAPKPYQRNRPSCLRSNPEEPAIHRQTPRTTRTTPRAVR